MYILNIYPKPQNVIPNFAKNGRLEVMRRFLLLIPLIVLILVAVFFGLLFIAQNASDEAHFVSGKPAGKDNPFSKRYSQGKCMGEGTTIFTYSPMRVEDISRIEPYGVMIDAHVIPTSHGYISPAVFHSPPDAYPVFAPADGTIVFVSYRNTYVGDNPNEKGKATVGDYQLYFEHSCTFYSYYDLLTSLSPEIEKEVGTMTGSFWNKGVRIPIKAGQLVGRIGGRTVDFAVWNFAKEPAYFANPKSYWGDEDRFFLEDMFAYFAEPLKSQLLAKNLRTTEPRSGRVNYDKEGKLVGNWFRQGSGGFNGPKETQGQVGRRYWDGHLSISYNFIDPTQITFSIGNFEGKAAQFSVVGNSPDPATIGVESGLIKYELTSTVAPDSPPRLPRGTVLLQLVGPAKLKLELFPGKTKEQVSGFTSKAIIYER